MSWGFFDKIYCINLKTRNDRYKACKKLFRKLSIPVHFHRVDKHPISGAQGCYESHLSIIKDAYDKGYQHILIFEDDIMTNERYSTELLQHAFDFMSTNKDWELFYFGHCPDIMFYKTSNVNKHIMHTYSVLAHAYGVSRRHMEKILNSKHKEYHGIAIDEIYQNNDHSYALYPMIFEQNREVTSDIPTSHPLQGLRFKEDYCYIVNYPIMYWIILLIVIVVILVLFWFF